MGAYLMNSLKAEKTQLQKRLREAMARHARLEGQFHPSRRDQGQWIELLKKMIGLVDTEIKREEVTAS